MDDLYNNLKVYEPEVKGMSSSSLSTQNMAFVSSSNNNTSSTNEAVNTSHGVSTASTQVNAANSTNIDNLSDVVIYAFFASQPNSPQLVPKDLQQIHPDDIEKMDLRWQMPMLTMRAKSATTATREDILLGSAELQEIKTRRTRKAQEGVQRKEEGPNYALMAYSSSSSNSDVSNDSNLEEKLEFYKKKESVYVEKINGLKWDIQVGEITIRELRKKLEKIQKEKDSIQFNIDKFENSSKSLNKLIECQIVDNCKKGLGYEKYNAVPPAYTRNFMPPTPDLSFTGLDEFVNKPIVENRKFDEEVSKVVRKSDDSPIIEDWVSDSEEESVSQTKTEKKTVKPSIAKKEFVKHKQQEKTTRKTVKQGNIQMNLQDQGVIDSGCSRHMTGNMFYLIDYEEIDGGYVAFGGNPKGRKITGKDPKSSQDDGSKPSSDDEKKIDEDPRKDCESIDQEKDDNVNNTNNVNDASTNEVNYVEADMNNLDTTIQVSPNPTKRIHKDHPLNQVIGDFQSTTQIRNMSKNLEENGFVKGIDYDEVIAPVARIKEIRLFLAYASFKDFAVYQMDVKSAFLYGKIEEDVYVCQPPGFEDPDFPDRVYKVEKALYGLHQAPRAWYETLSTYLLYNGVERGKIDKTLFIRRHKGDILLVQVFVDDIIFGSTNKKLCIAFEKLMHEKFQMSSMGELTFFF
ncbi:putative ribonuclease H-like domain-containing protein [Tanacetum coccineum]